MIKFLQKGDFYLSLLTVAHYFFYASKLHAELRKKNSSHSHSSYKLERNIVKLITFTGKQTKKNTRKKHSRSYHLIIMMSIFSLLFSSFCRFHGTFGVNQIVSMPDLLFLFIFEFISTKKEHK